MGELAWVNGRETSLVEAQVSLLDRGYLFGDGVYEVVRVYNGVPFTLELHMKRLENSLAGIQISMPFSVLELKSLIRGLVARSELQEAQVYIQITRGTALRQHAFPPDTQPSVAIYVASVNIIDPGIRKIGVKVVTAPDLRWANCFIKSLNLLPNVLAKEAAKAKGAAETIFVRDGGIISEGSSSNVFAVINGRLVTPMSDGHILEGITRHLCFRLGDLSGHPVQEEFFTLAVLRLADEIFITSTTMEILPVVELDQKLVGRGVPGSVTLDLYENYQELLRKV